MSSMISRGIKVSFVLESMIRLSILQLELAVCFPRDVGKKTVWRVIINIHGLLRG